MNIDEDDADRYLKRDQKQTFHPYRFAVDDQKLQKPKEDIETS